MDDVGKRVVTPDGAGEIVDMETPFPGEQIWVKLDDKCFQGVPQLYEVEDTSYESTADKGA